LCKFRDIDVKWRENIERLEEDIPKGDISYTVQGRETVTGKVRVGRDRGRYHKTVACKGMVTIIKILTFGFAELCLTSPRHFVTHTEKSD